MQKVYSVNSVALEILDTHPRQLLITAVGQVVSSGWTGPELIAHSVIGPPSEGLLDFDFGAKPPTGGIRPAFFPIVAQTVWQGDAAAVRGVRIHASANQREAFLKAAQPPSAVAESLAGIKTPPESYPEGLPLSALAAHPHDQEAGKPKVRLGGELKKEATVAGEGSGLMLYDVLVEVDASAVPSVGESVGGLAVVEGEFELINYPRRGLVWTFIADEIRPHRE